MREARTTERSLYTYGYGCCLCGQVSEIIIIRHYFISMKYDSFAKHVSSKIHVKLLYMRAHVVVESEQKRLEIYTMFEVNMLLLN